MIDIRMLIFAVVFGGQYNTLSQIARLLVALYLAYIGKTNDILPNWFRDTCKFVSLIYFCIVIAAALINTVDYLNA